MYHKKYRKGPTIKSMIEFAKIIENKQFIFWRDFPRPKSYKWMQNLQYIIIVGLIKSRVLYKALENK